MNTPTTRPPINSGIYSKTACVRMYRPVSVNPSCILIVRLGYVVCTSWCALVFLL